MSRSRRLSCSALLTLGILLIGLSLACVVWVKKEQRQYALNRQLIAALVKNDPKRALVLVESGADPNTRYELMPAPTLFQLVNRLLNCSSPPVNDSPTAFMIACGAIWEYEMWHHKYSRLKSLNPQLIQQMLFHGANANAKSIEGWTALYWAIDSQNKDIIKQLLAFGVDPDIKTDGGDTSIDVAESDHRSDIVALLRQYSKRP